MKKEKRKKIKDKRSKVRDKSLPDWHIEISISFIFRSGGEKDKCHVLKKVDTSYLPVTCVCSFSFLLLFSFVNNLNNC